MCSQAQQSNGQQGYGGGFRSCIERSRAGSGLLTREHIENTVAGERTVVPGKRPCSASNVQNLCERQGIGRGREIGESMKIAEQGTVCNVIVNVPSKAPVGSGKDLSLQAMSPSGRSDPLPAPINGGWLDPLI